MACGHLELDSDDVTRHGIVHSAEVIEARKEVNCFGHSQSSLELKSSLDLLQGSFIISSIQVRVTEEPSRGRRAEVRKSLATREFLMLVEQQVAHAGVVCLKAHAYLSCRVHGSDFTAHRKAQQFIFRHIVVAMILNSFRKLHSVAFRLAQLIERT